MSRLPSLVLVLLALWASPSDAQWLPMLNEAAQPARHEELVQPDSASRARWYHPVMAAVLPGSGQLASGQDRGLVYLAAEAYLWTRFLVQNGEGKRERDAYRDLAFSVARAQFSPARRDTTFEYFEMMEKYVESGPFDIDPGPNLVPPFDERTYNGSMWKLARETFFLDPLVLPDTSSEEYRRAIEFYVARAVGPNFQWSWRNAGLEQDLYRQSIERSDDAFKSATQYLGLILANHLISVVDAFVSYRLSTEARSVGLSSGVWFSPGYGGGMRSAMSLRIGF